MSEGTVELVSGDVRVRSGFRVVDSAPSVAGGPIEVEFFVDNVGAQALHLLVNGDRARHRPGSFSFVATLAGVTLPDPYAEIPYRGGPATVVTVEPTKLYRQTLLVNQFVCLENSLDLLEPGASGQLVVDCRRPLPLTADHQAALTSAGDAPLVAVRLEFGLRRDDAQLSALVDQLVDEVRHGPREQRERPLALLLTLRAPVAVGRWRALLDHADPVVVARVRQALQLADQLAGR
jgi:hypothetical protein